MKPGNAFLTTEWRNLAMLNYEVDPLLLLQYIPPGTELDQWHGKTYVSLVGLQFKNTQVQGFSIPMHRDFDEVNLRFYVRREQGTELRKGVVFIREIVPRWAVATIARVVYNEPYICLPMSHSIESLSDSGAQIEYSWQSSSGWNRMLLATEGSPTLPIPGSHEEFITEHYWGYGRTRGGRGLEYRVEHQPWRVWSAHAATFEGEMSELYGAELSMLLQTRPASALLAEGSEVKVYRAGAI